MVPVPVRGVVPAGLVVVELFAAPVVDCPVAGLDGCGEVVAGVF